jgi:putative copper export protein
VRITFCVSNQPRTVHASPQSSVRSGSYLLRSGSHGRAMWQLQRNSLIEVGLGLLILAIVAVLGRTPPHMHE